MKNKKMSKILFPFYKENCLYCNNKIGFIDSFLREHSPTGIRYVVCKHCKTINYNDFNNNFIFDETTNKFVIDKTEGHTYRTGGYLWLSPMNFPIIVGLVAVFIGVIISLLRF